jgi:DNA-binding LytR/AlgR family response regulator
MKDKTTLRLSCLLVDDEESAHTVLRELIEDVPWLSVEGSCYNAMQAVETTAQKKFDIIFLDVRMPGLNGLDLLELLQYPRPYIIMTTGFREYAYDGFEHEVTDFLLKPISARHFMKAVLKIRRLCDKFVEAPPITDTQNFEVLSTSLEIGWIESAQNQIWLRAAGKSIPVRLKDIYFVQALKDYVRVYYKQGTLVIYGNLGSMATKLPKAQFVRLNRSYIINRYAILEIEGNTVKMLNGFEILIPVKSSRVDIIKELTS